MALSKSSQFLALQHYTCELSIAISLNLIKVAEKLFAKEVISQAQLKKALLSTRVEDERASELVIQVLDQVEVGPEKFNAFLQTLEESSVSHKLVTLVREVHKKYEEKQIIEVSLNFLNASR